MCDWWFTGHISGVWGISFFSCGFLHLLWSNCILEWRTLSAPFSLLLCVYISHSRLIGYKLASIDVAAVEILEDISQGLFSLFTGFCGHMSDWNIRIYFASCHSCASKTLYTPNERFIKAAPDRRRILRTPLSWKFPICTSRLLPYPKLLLHLSCQSLISLIILTRHLHYLPCRSATCSLASCCLRNLTVLTSTELRQIDEIHD